MSKYKIINQVFKPAFRKPCWNVRPGYGSFLTMEIGKPALRTYDPLRSHYVDKDPDKPLNRRNVVVHGQWHLWIYCCKWVVHHRGKKVGYSPLTTNWKKPIEKAAFALDGQMLTSVEIDPSKGSSEFRFDLGGVLSTEPYEKDTEQWLFYCPSGKVLTYRSDGKYSYNLSSSRKDHWLAFDE